MKDDFKVGGLLALKILANLIIADMHIRYDT